MKLAHLKALIKRIPIPFTKNQGYDILTAKIIKRQCTARSNCIDVGALEGEVTRHFLKYAPLGTHFAFEPLPYYSLFLKKKYGDRLTVINKAVSDKAGRSTFHFVKSNPPYSGILQRRYDRPTEEIEEINVELCTLDSEIPGDLPVHLIKIDVEGAELPVLRGAERILEVYGPLLIFEHGMGGADVYGYGPDGMWSFLVDRLGYRIYRLKDWYTGKFPLTLDKFREDFHQGREYYFVATKV